MRRTAILLGAGLLFAAPLADAGLRYVGGRVIGETAIGALRRLAADGSGFSFRHAALDPWHGMLRIDDLRFGARFASIRIGHLTYTPDVTPSLIVVAARAATGTVAAENITVDSSDATYQIARIEMSGTDLSADDLKALFDAKSSVPFAERLSRISAAKINIPEISVQLKSMPTNGGIVYHNLELDNVVKAKVAQGTLSGLDATWITPGSGAAEAHCGPARTQDYDIAQNVRIMSETAAEGETPKPLYGSFSVTACKLKFDKAQAVVDIGALSLTDVRGRPPKQSWTSAKALFKTDPDDAADAALLARRRAYFADVFSAYAVKAVEARDLTISRAQGDTTVAGSFAKISLANFAASKVDEIRVDGTNFNVNGTKLKLTSLALRRLDLAVLGKLLAHDSGAPAPSLAAMSQFVAEGLDVDAVDNKAQGGSHIRFQLARIDLTGTGLSDGIPTQFAMALDHFTADLSELNLPNAADVAALGYGKVDLSSRLAANFDRDKQILAVEDISLTGKDMGAVTLSGQFSRISDDLFSHDQAVAEAAMLSALVNRVEIRVENTGLFERIIAAAAKRQNKSADEIRRNYVEAVSVGVPAMLENGPSAKLIGAALAKFVAAPKNFRLVARALNGLGASDFALIKQPGALLEKLDIEAAANE